MKRLWLLIVLLISITSCAYMQTLRDSSEKKLELIAYYEDFSYGLKLATNLLSTEKQTLANAAIASVDYAISILKENITTKNLQDVQSKIEVTNTVVGAGVSQ